MLAWSAVWIWMSVELDRRMDAGRDRLRSAGFEVSWTHRKVHGFPFRIDVDLSDARLREPSGWGLSAPSLKAEAFVFSPTHWVAVAPDGLTFLRPLGGPVVVGARVLRASLSAAAAHPPRLSVEGLDLTFTPAPGARSFFLTDAGEFHLHTRAGPDDQGAIYIEVDKARARLTGLVAKIAADRPVGLTVDAIYSRAQALSGRDWPSAVRRWSAAGGALTLREARLTAGEAVLEARGGALSVGPDGRLTGSVVASLRQAPRALAVMGQTGAISPEAAAAAAQVVGARLSGPAATVTLDFQAGQTTLGPVALGPAPRVF